jgi:hypothetical protein
METLKRFIPSASTRALWPLGIAAAVLIVLGNSSFARASDETTVRWDIIHLNPPTVLDLTAGGIASALAQDGSKITVTGSGTFKVEDGNFEDVTGGGAWTIGSASGTYRVREVVAFTPAPGSLPSAVNDLIGNRANASSGLLVFRISYSDGSKGSLVVSCDLPVGTPPGLFEGITATKGFVGFWNNLPPVGGVDANRTTFHIVPGEAEDED